MARHASTTSAMAVLVVTFLASFLPSTALASFSPAFSFFLACGATSNVTFPHDSPARTFVPDAPFLTGSSGVPAVTDASTVSASPLYANARASSSAFSYNLALPGSGSGQRTALLVLRLHFFSFAASSQSISGARFMVSVLGNKYTLLSSFSPPSGGVVKEFFVPAGGSSDFRITFTPETGLSTFVNAVELFPAPAGLLWNGTVPVTAVGTAAGLNVSLWPQQALETLYRLNVSGPKVTRENDTLWRTWLPDDAFLFDPLGLSVLSSTSAAIIYDAAYAREVAPDIVYRTQRAARSVPATSAPEAELLKVTWYFPAELGSDYLIRLHFCDYELLSSVVGVGIVFNVSVVRDVGTQDLTPAQIEAQENQAFYLDYVAKATIDGILTVSIHTSNINSNTGEGGFLNGLEIMKLRPPPSDSHAHAGGKRRALIITLSAVFGGASVLAGAVLCSFLLLLLRRRKHPAPQTAPEEDNSTPLPWSPGAMQKVSSTRFYSLEELKAATDSFHEHNLIGVGGFGNVYRGVLRDGTRVAVKRASRSSQQGLPEFQTEIAVLSRIRHRHLVSLFGYCNEHAEMILVYEHMEKGTLRRHLYGAEEETPPSWKQRLEICIGAARGLHYLHTGYSDSVIIHRDVKSTNILLGDGYVAKVADFGLSRAGPPLGETHVSTEVKGSFGYLDPEYFKTHQLTDRSDVYSLGVVLFEVLCARPVIDLAREHVSLAEWVVKGQLDRIVDPRIAGQVNEDSLRQFAETAEKCLADHGLDRPSMGDVLWNLEQCLQLQETHESRPDALEDSGAAATPTWYPDDVVLPAETIEDGRRG